MDGKAFAYIVRCRDGTLYCGWTDDLGKRVKAHNEGVGAKYTRGRGPVNLVYFEEFENKSEALKREIEIKKMTKEKKEKLI